MQKNQIDKKEIVRLHSIGFNGGEIGRKLGISRQRVSQVLKLARMNPASIEKIPDKGKKQLSDNDLSNMVLILYQHGYSINSIAIAFNFSYTKTQELLATNPQYKSRKGDKKEKIIKLAKTSLIKVLLKEK